MAGNGALDLEGRRVAPVGRYAALSRLASLRERSFAPPTDETSVNYKLAPPLVIILLQFRRETMKQ
jgi:hypothetical protein